MLQNLDEEDVLGKEDVVERLHILVGALDRDAITKSDALGLMGEEPVCGIRVDEQAGIFLGV